MELREASLRYQANLRNTAVGVLLGVTVSYFGLLDPIHEIGHIAWAWAEGVPAHITSSTSVHVDGPISQKIYSGGVEFLLGILWLVVVTQLVAGWVHLWRGTQPHTGISGIAIGATIDRLVTMPHLTDFQHIQQQFGVKVSVLTGQIAQHYLILNGIALGLLLITLLNQTMWKHYLVDVPASARVTYLLSIDPASRGGSGDCTAHSSSSQSCGPGSPSE